MESAVNPCILRGRAWRGVTILLKSDNCRDVSFVLCKERYVILVMADSCFVNAYLPSGDNPNNIDTLLGLLSDIDEDIIVVKSKFTICNWFFGGDMNVNVKCNLRASRLLKDFASRL